MTKAVSSIARASEVKRLRRPGYAEHLLRTWHDMGPFVADGADESSPHGTAGGDLVEQALACLVQGAVGQRGVSVPQALEHLKVAELHFRSLSMDAMCQAARVEFAWHVRDAGHPLRALALLAPATAPAAGWLAQSLHSVRSLCLQDLARLDEAAASLREASSAFSEDATEDSQRSQWYFRVASSRLNATGALLRRRFECHLTERALGRGMPKAAGEWQQQQGLNHVLRPTALPPPRSAELKGKVLQCLVGAAAVRHDPAYKAVLMQTAAACASQPQDVGAQAWLWLGTAQLSAGSPKLALACLGHAVEAARATGCTGVQRDALIDLVQAFEQVGSAENALAALKDLRRLEAELLEGPGSEAHSAPMQQGWATPDPSSVRNPHLRQALGLLWEAGKPFSIDSLASACGVSRRTLEKAFRAELGRSVAECLRERRLSLVRTRLLQSQDPVKTIALGCGYPSTSALCHEFKRSTGMTPASFRARAHGLHVDPVE